MAGGRVWGCLRFLSICSLQQLAERAPQSSALRLCRPPLRCAPSTPLPLRSKGGEPHLLHLPPLLAWARAVVFRIICRRKAIRIWAARALNDALTISCGSICSVFYWALVSYTTDIDKNLRQIVIKATLPLSVVRPNSSIAPDNSETLRHIAESSFNNPISRGTFEQVQIFLDKLPGVLQAVFELVHFL